MASSTKSAGTGSNLTGVGSNAWTSPGNIVSANGSYAYNNQGDTNYVRASNFGFTIPSTATITGVVVKIKRYCPSSNRVNDTYLRLVNAAGVVSGNNKASSSYWPTSNTVATYGASNDLWGLTLTPTDVNDVDFGVALACDDNYIFILKPHVYAYVDHVEITIYYSDITNMAATISQTATVVAVLHRMIGCVASITQTASFLGALSTYVNFIASIIQNASLTSNLKSVVNFAVSIIQNSTLTAGSKIEVKLASAIEQLATVTTKLRIPALLAVSIQQLATFIPKGSSSWTSVTPPSNDWDDPIDGSDDWTDISDSTNWTEL